MVSRGLSMGAIASTASNPISEPERIPDRNVATMPSAWLKPTDHEPELAEVESRARKSKSHPWSACSM